MKPWAYPDDDEPWREPPTPSWDCPQGLCRCHASESSDGYEFCLLLCDETGTRMPHARARVKQGGRLLLDGEADDDGWLLFELTYEASRVLVEWSPATMPKSPTYPFRQQYFLSLGSDDDAPQRRLANLGFSDGDDLDSRVRRFQHRHAYTRITGRLEHIAEDLARYHDQSRYPIVPLDLPAQVLEQPAPPGPEDGPPPEPQVPDGPSPPAPPTAGRPQTGGGTPPGRGTIAPTVVSTLLVRLRARFSLKPDLTDIRLADGGQHLPQLASATVELRVRGMSLIGQNNSSTNHPDGILSSIDLTPLRQLLVPPPPYPVDAELVLTPGVGHVLPRSIAGTRALKEPVGPTDGVPAGISKGHMLFRPLHVDVLLDPVTTRPLFAAVSQKMTFKLPKVGGEPEHDVSNGGVAIRGNDTLIVDWRPDYVQCRHDTVKGVEFHPTTGAPLGHSRFIHVHESNSGDIGSAIMRFFQYKTGPSAHYIVDRDGFVVKMANENIQAVHAGGGGATGGGAWFDLRSQPHGPQLPATIAAFNNISVGIEHVHRFRKKSELRKPTIFKVEQMQASRHLIGMLKGTFGVSGHNVLADSQTAVANHMLGRKIGCPGSGYDWARLEDAGLATRTRSLQPPAGHPLHPLYQMFDAYFGANNSVHKRITEGAPLMVRFALQGLLASLGYHVPLSPQPDQPAPFAAMELAIEAFQLRHFGGPGRDLKPVQTPSRRPIINRLTIDTMFGVLDERGPFAY